ncbi:hypothetical protein I2900191A2_06420 [Intestinibacter bartlettii]
MKLKQDVNANLLNLKNKINSEKYIQTYVEYISFIIYNRVKILYYRVYIAWFDKI